MKTSIGSDENVVNAKKKDVIIAVDFDGTLVENKWPEIGDAIEPVVKYVKHRQSNGARIILWTNRSGDRLNEAVNWCSDHGIILDAINENLPDAIEFFGGDCRKIFANEYLDDRAVSPKQIEIKISEDE